MPSASPPRQRRGHGRVTLRDVASAAGVTAITVSRFLRSPGLVAEGTAHAVNLALVATGYVPNKQAGLLASGRSDIVAALVPNLAHSIFAETLQGLSDTLAGANLELLVAATGYSQEREESQLRALLGWHPCAIVVTGHHHSPTALTLLREAAKRDCVVVEVWDQRKRRRRDLAEVGFSHRDAGRTMAAHLIGRGARTLTYVDSAVAEDFRAHERGDGFEMAARLAGVPCTRLVASAGDPMDAGRAVLPTLIASASRPTACAMANDHLAVGALLEAQQRGIDVPGQLAIMGFGDFPIARQMTPALTTVAPPRREIGIATAELILRNLSASESPRPAIELPCPLVIRASA